MAVRIHHSDEASMYFCTFTCFNWLNLFEITNSYDLAYKWFSYLRTDKQVETIAYVIMPNHLHCILYFPEEGYDLNKIIGNAKRFMAYEIVKRLEKCDHVKILEVLANGVEERKKMKGQKHKLFEDSFDAKPIYTDAFFYQKLDYIHLNPVTGKWNLVEDYRLYPHSSASFYELEKQGFFVPKDYRDI